ncbi:MAG: carboxypeptidase M32 [Limnochordales bacterium]|nr:carboxypeptidase M32 [Limnochordales bacterium]
MGDALRELREIIADVAALRAADAVLGWDQETYMPAGGAAARARHRAALARMAHERFTAPRVGELLDALRDREGNAPDLEDLDAQLVRRTRILYERARRLPPNLVQELAHASALAVDAWRDARQAADFRRLAPHLERLVALTIEKAEHLGYQDDIYDALLDEYEPGMTTAEVEQLFAGLKARLVPLVQAVAGAPQVDDAFLRQPFDPQQQWAFGMDVLRAIGFDLVRGRQDQSAHPFTTSFSQSDVRITTRLRADDWASGFFATLHEAGHGLHAQGIPPALDGTPLAWETSLGVSESQSRLWENVVGRSRGFWEFWLPQLAERFPQQLAGVDLDRFYRAINRVEPSFIRVEADELTYNLHIFVRFELERALVARRLEVRDLPAAWNAKMEEYLGIVPGNDAEGVLQDIHWSMGAWGYFPTYTLGNVLSVQYFAQAVREHPEIPAEIRQGRFDTLRVWTQERIHRWGAMLNAAELTRHITGGPLDSGPYVQYLEEKYREIYRL